MNKKQILIIEDLGISVKDLENKFEDTRMDYSLVWDMEKADSEAVRVLVNVKKKVDAELINQFPNLKMIAVAFTGYDSVDLDACKDNGIVVYNVPDYSTHSVAELVIGLAIGLLREIPKADELVRQNKWFMPAGRELHGKTVGILGTGKIGLATTRIFKAMGCKLIAWSRSENELFTNLGGKYVFDKQKFFAQADIVSVHVPYNIYTHGLVGKEELKSMKKDAYLINTARGPIVDEDALIQALKNKEIAGAGLDVFSEEPIPHDHALKSLDNVILTPHIAYKTEEALQRRADVTLQNIQDFLDGKTWNKVN